MHDQKDLAQLTAAQLRAKWRKAHKGQIMPQGLGRDLATRAIVWRDQERIHGGLPRSAQRELERLASQLEETGNIEPERGLKLKVGTRLVRQWHGQIYQVQILEDGFEFEHRQYRSLTQIAREITGAAWSGPRFFGLKAKPHAGD
ncbi:DUF2924 domain-containing protein [Parasphingorhabdus sp.]|uniref:DUF2924 domain-containing protein n=1 Tax=Parasphingorhabdus sp. TaxID=2709688 RepID=UPI0030B48316